MPDTAQTHRATATACPRLWCDAQDLAALQRRLSAGDEHLQALITRCRDVAGSIGSETDGGWSEPVQAQLLLAVLAEDDPVGRIAACWEAIEARLRSDPVLRSDLRRAHLAVTAAQVLDLGGHLLEPAALQRAAQLTADLAAHFQQRQCSGNPHVVTNNWWAVTHGAALMAALSAHLRGGQDCTGLIAWAGGRLWPFCHPFGDQGLYHEGLGYQCYTLCYLLPALLAWRRCGGRDALARFPQFERSAASLLLATSLRPTPPDSVDERQAWGAMLSWNDAGPGAPDHAMLPAVIACAPEGQQGALRWIYDHLRGHAGDRRFAPDHGGLVLSALLYPYHVTPTQPDAVLPRCLTDGRTGFHLARNRWQDGDDAVFGVLARCTHVGGHQQDDAAALRFAALGHDWIVGGGQNRPQAQWQSLPTPADGIRGKQPKACGALVWDEPTAHGSIVGIDHRQACLCYSERYLAFRSAPEQDGVAAALAILDLIDDHHDRDWHWNLSFGPGLELSIDQDQGGFALIAPDGARLRARFLIDRPQRITRLRMPDTSRTYSGGGTVHYPGRPVLRAHFAAKRPLHVLLAATVERGEPPVPVLGPELAIDLGSSRWERPFGAIIPAGFRPGRSPSLMTNPDGLGGPRHIQAS